MRLRCPHLAQGERLQLNGLLGQPAEKVVMFVQDPLGQFTRGFRVDVTDLLTLKLGHRRSHLRRLLGGVGRGGLLDFGRLLFHSAINVPGRRMMSTGRNETVPLGRALSCEGGRRLTSPDTIPEHTETNPRLGHKESREDTIRVQAKPRFFCELSRLFVAKPSVWFVSLRLGWSTLRSGQDLLD